MNTLKSAALFVAAIFTTIMVSRYLTMNPEVYFQDQREIYLAHPIALLAHVSCGMVATMIGPFQFVQGFRMRHVLLHRIMGVCYITACFIGGGAGIVMATRAHGGFPASMGFGFLGVAWIVCSGLALHRALVQRFPSHREWMIRSYALTLAAFTLRIILGAHGTLRGFELTDLGFTDMYIAVAWLCWVPNLMIAEWYLTRTRIPQAAAA